MIHIVGPNLRRIHFLLDSGDSWNGSTEFMDFFEVWKDTFDLEIRVSYVNLEKKREEEDTMGQEAAIKMWTIVLKWYFLALVLTMFVFYLYTSMYPVM
jgi:hypothetical protein